MVHLVYCDDKTKELDLLLSGQKKMLIRAAAGRKIPHSRVENGEDVYLMEKGSGLISAIAKVKSVQNYVKLSPDEIEEILIKNQALLCLNDKQKQRWAKKCMCLVELEHVKQIDPLNFERQGNMDDWLILERIDDVLIGTSIPFTYDHAKFK